MCTYLRTLALGLCLVVCAPFLSVGQIATNFYEPDMAVALGMVHPPSSFKSIQIAHGSFDGVLQEDVERQKKGLPFRFAKPLNASVSLSDGIWTTTSDQRLWHVMLTSKDALSIGVMFDRLQLVDGAKLYLYNTDQTVVIGPIEKDHITSQRANIDIIEADQIIIELQEPKNTSLKSNIHINKILHGYRELGTQAGASGLSLNAQPIPAEGDTMKIDQNSSVTTNAVGDALSCNIDVSDSRARGWDNQDTGVSIIIFPDGSSCSGCLVNNTQQDQRSYYLTAAHCRGNIENAIFRFHFMRTTPGSSTLRPTISYTGSQVRGIHNASDVLLVELNNRVFYSSFLGWDSQNSRPPTGGVYLHHPAGDVMKFSIGYDNPRLVGQYWFQRLSLGGLEPGSSGAPVMEGADQNRLIFGPVSGGDLDNGGCGRDVEARVGSFFGAWTGGGTAATRLSNWLSPGNASRRELVTLSIRPAMPSVSGGRGALPHLVLVEAKNSYNSRQYDWEMVAPNNSVTRQTTSSNKTYFTLYDMPSGTYKFRSRGRNGAGTGNWSNYYYTGYTAYPSLSVKDRPAANSLIAVYPNPSANRIMVDGTTMKDNSVLEDDLNLSFIELFDEAGELVFRSDINDDKIEIITELYKAGTYIMHVHHDKGVVKERVLIER